LKRRNAILKHRVIEPRNRNLIDLLTKELIDLGKIIQSERLLIIEKLNSELERTTSSNHFNSYSNLRVLYKPEELDTVKAGNIFKEELRRGISLIGAHLDDVIIENRGQSVKDYSSDGEQKMATIILKLCELNIIENETRNSPVLLLDDLFSELDSENSFAVISYLKDKSQIFLTSLDLISLDNIKTFHLEPNINNLCIN